MPSNHLILCCLLLLPSVFPSIRVFSIELTLCIRWPKCGVSPSASVLPMNIQNWFPLGLTEFDFLAVQGTLKSLLQHYNSKASVFQLLAFFMVLLSHPCMTTGKAIALTICTFVSKVMSLFFNMLSRFVLVFLPRSKNLLISWLWSLSAVILEPKKIKSFILLVSYSWQKRLLILSHLSNLETLPILYFLSYFSFYLAYLTSPEWNPIHLLRSISKCW